MIERSIRMFTCIKDQRDTLWMSLSTCTMNEWEKRVLPLYICTGSFSLWGAGAHRTRTQGDLSVPEPPSGLMAFHQSSFFILSFKKQVKCSSKCVYVFNSVCMYLCACTCVYVHSCIFLPEVTHAVPSSMWSFWGVSFLYTIWGLWCSSS